MDPYKIIGSSVKTVEPQDPGYYTEVFVLIRERRHPTRFIVHAEGLTESPDDPICRISVLCSGPTLDDAITWTRAKIKKANLLMPEMHQARSEERRVGKECRSRWSPYH